MINLNDRSKIVRQAARVNVSVTVGIVLIILIFFSAGLPANQSCTHHLSDCIPYLYPILSVGQSHGIPGILSFKRALYPPHTWIIGGQMDRSPEKWGTAIENCLLKFLPFVDDDPRSAELLSKVPLLARDKEIKDPLILQQLR